MGIEQQLKELEKRRRRGMRLLAEPREFFVGNVLHFMGSQKAGDYARTQQNYNGVVEAAHAVLRRLFSSEQLVFSLQLIAQLILVYPELDG
jgi:hypothetical protein